MRLPKGVTKRGEKFRVSVGSGATRSTVIVADVYEAIETRTLLQAESFIPRDVKTLQDAYTQTVRECWGRAKSGTHSAAVALRVLEYFSPLLPLTDITRTALVDMEEHFRQHGNTDATINRKLSALSKMLHVAYEHGWVSTLPVMHRKKEGRGRIRYFSVEEERAILALCYEWGKADHGDCIQVLLDTGMRPSEVFNLEKRDINFQHNLIHIFENKTDHPRSLPMTKRVRAILLTRTTTRSKPFPYEGRWLDYVWTRVRVTLGMQDDEQFVPYTCRHTCATRLLQRGFTLPELQKWLGHKSLTMTMRYAHLSPTALLKGAQLLEQEVPHETPFTGSIDALYPHSVCGEQMSRVRGAEHPHLSSAELESATLPGVCATTPSRTL